MTTSFLPFAILIIRLSEHVSFYAEQITKLLFACHLIPYRIRMLQLFAVTDTQAVALMIPAAAKSFEDLFKDLKPGVYTAMRTFEGHKFLALDQHLQRTEDSIASLGWEYEFDQTRIRRALDQICRQGGIGDKRIRIDVLAAPATAYASSRRELIACMPFTPPDEVLYRQGAHTVTCADIERLDPKVKSAEFSRRRQAYISTDAAIHEQLLVDGKGRILEGFSSNFYAVKQGCLYTAAAGVLAGTVRTIVLQLAARAAVPVVHEAVALSALGDFQEAAISSSSRGLMPVVRIDNRVIGTGRPGPVINALMQHYRDYIAWAVRPAL